MKKIIMILVFMLISAWYCPAEDNPLLGKFNTPFGVPDFGKIKEEHYLPAFKGALKLHDTEIEAIVNNKKPATFENTIEALDRSGEILAQVSGVFDVLNESMTNDNMQKIASEVAPLRTKHLDDILLNEKLFQRVKNVYKQKDTLKLTAEQQMLLDKIYKAFVRGGANLEGEKKEQLRKINEELAVLQLQFGNNVLKEENRFELVIEKEEDMAGLPDWVKTTAAEAAKESGKEGKWIFTTQKPSMIPFLQYADKRELREKIFRAYIMRGDNGDDLDNNADVRKIVNLRIEKANLLGYKTHADYVLEINMAKKPEKVYALLDQIWKPALKRAMQEILELQAMIDNEGNDFILQPWDWWYYAEKVKKAKYAFDEETLKPYFKLENVINGAFEVATKLWGITFIERNDMPKYHPDVKVFEVKDTDGSTIAILYTDYFPRASKRGGAWMNNFREQYRIGKKNFIPIITNNGNFTKPTADQPSLLSTEEVETLFHEFGHALHGLLSNCTYRTTSGTNVARDFVELPSQIMENWAFEPEVLKMYAKHYQTSEVIPQELMDKMKSAEYFNQGFITVEFLAAAFLDMDWHTVTKTQDWNVYKFDNESMKVIQLMPEIVVRYRSTYFRHIFSGEYSSGYYSYIWSEVLDADAFEAFKEHGIFDQKTALSFRKNILEKGSSEDPMTLYVRFRGAEPKVEPLLKNRGLL
ncbi:MAG: peptidase M3 [Candidatus Fischerbacteria bacterium RBG_13_37_8]|uniref:Peptidase M3 n=1 Tax=Candidatus Fischerbacteria bacterium RBG_13_37_8 TaxID=1817863 RepID=A0A1F5VY43_9BACT|nr:MAG: peptidase M3 [Candidatus Fischerbacteria bacterium RBG_13_37_8]